MRFITHRSDRLLYTLTTEEKCNLWVEARRRTLPKEKNPELVRDKRRAPIENTLMHYIGLAGEYIFHRYSGLPLDMSVGLCGDKTKDFFCRGKSMEVKTLRGWLAFDRDNWHNEFIADFAILANYIKEKNGYPGNTVYLEGWTDKDNFLKHAFEHDFGYGPRLCIQPSDLYGIQELLDFISGKSNGQKQLELFDRTTGRLL